MSKSISFDGTDHISEELTIPVFHQFHHERQAEALEAALPTLERKNTLSAQQTALQLNKQPQSNASTVTPLACSHKVKVDTTSPDLLYFILVDRFANGDTQNDVLVDTTRPSSLSRWRSRRRKANLDHIQSLGADAIWLSPIYQNENHQVHGHGAFHGYWTEDLRYHCTLDGW